MITISLQTGSNGNCFYVESNGTKLLFDAGISGIEAERRLALYGRNIREIDGLIISHDHSDHIRYAGVYQRKYGIPVYITSKTLDTAERKQNLGKLSDIRNFKSNGIIKFGSLSVEAIPTPHDGVDCSVFVVNSGRKRLGILTDLGHLFNGLYSIVKSLDAVFIESNYDPEMLAKGPYPLYLKRRIKGPAGHISNIESAELLKSSASKRLKWACLAHLSEHNNNPDLALKTHRNILNPNFPLYVASRYGCSEILTLK